jgi:hypothetical protein
LASSSTPNTDDETVIMPAKIEPVLPLLATIVTNLPGMSGNLTRVPAVVTFNTFAPLSVPKLLILSIPP